MLAELSLEPECRRGHGAVYDALNCGQVQIGRLRRALAGLPLPAWMTADPAGCRCQQLVAAGRGHQPQRVLPLLCAGQGERADDPGWPYSLVAALEPGRTSWTLPLDAVRLGPADDATEVTAAQVREVVERIIEAGHWHAGDPDVLVVFDSGYDLTRLAWLLPICPSRSWAARSDRVMYFPAPPRPARPAARAAAAPARGRAQALRPANLGRPVGNHQHPDRPVRHRTGDAWGRCPATGQPRRLGGPRRPAAGHRGHPHPAGRRSPAW